MGPRGGGGRVRVACRVSGVSCVVAWGAREPRRAARVNARRTNGNANARSWPCEVCAARGVWRAPSGALREARGERRSFLTVRPSAGAGGGRRTPRGVERVTRGVRCGTRGLRGRHTAACPPGRCGATRNSRVSAERMHGPWPRRSARARRGAAGSRTGLGSCSCRWRRARAAAVALARRGCVAVACARRCGGRDRAPGGDARSCSHQIFT